jgi:hypothetical protein
MSVAAPFRVKPLLLALRRLPPSPAKLTGASVEI